MAKNLVIVESPSKARTIQRLLGKKYVAKACMGHVRDLPKKTTGVSVNDDSFKPTYTILADKRKLVSELTKASRQAETVYLATDPDREGEAISWHLTKAAKIDQSKVKRVVFHEITQRAVKEAFKKPRKLYQQLVDAQQARRILDRLVGYDLSPVLWAKIKSGLSAGRVQSVALRLVVDRERKIQAFAPKEYWTIKAELRKREDNGTNSNFEATLRSINGQRGKFNVPTETKAHEIVSNLSNAAYQVSSILEKEKRSRPAPPFITSTLQQEAWRKLKFTARRTMVIAQQLYEGINMSESDSYGLITYMRTDSTNVSSTALSETAAYIKDKFGPDYTPKTPRLYTKKVKGAQEAHEAIRPTLITQEPESIRKHLSKEQFQLYDLIWRRMLASQMTDALLDATTININSGPDESYVFQAVGSVLKFPGFRRIYMEELDDLPVRREENTDILPRLSKDEYVDCLSVMPEQHFTKPPSRYSEATLVRDLEEKGIGRPSTYAPTLSTVMDRDYVRKEKGLFVPTKLGTAVTDLLTTHFPDIMNVDFTAKIEGELDEIAQGKQDWQPVLREFYAPFTTSVKLAMEIAKRVPRNQIDEETNEVCEACERPMVIKSGRFGKFLSCSGFPKCKTSRPFLIKVGVKCPECSSDLVELKGKTGKRFYGCSAYPNCSFSTNRKPIPQPCPECSKLLVATRRNYSQCTSCEYNGPTPEDPPIEVAV